MKINELETHTRLMCAFEFVHKHRSSLIGGKMYPEKRARCEKLFDSFVRRVDSSVNSLRNELCRYDWKRKAGRPNANESSRTVWLPYVGTRCRAFCIS